MFFRKSLAVGIVLLAGICGFAQNSSSHSSVLNVEWLDRTVDPCVDLFTFSCGKWIQSNPIPPDQSSWGIYNKLQDDNLKQLRELLEATSAPNRPVLQMPKKLATTTPHAWTKRRLMR